MTALAVILFSKLFFSVESVLHSKMSRWNLFVQAETPILKFEEYMTSSDHESKCKCTVKMVSMKVPVAKRMYASILYQVNLLT